MGTVRIIGREFAPFRDRVQAGRLLAAQLEFLRGQRPVVLGIPRGGVLIAREIARALDGELDVVLARKLRAPDNPELAIGAVTETGEVFTDDALISHLRVRAEYLEEETQRQRQEIERRREAWRTLRPRVPLAKRAVVVTDDGVATGATMHAALRAARAEGPARLVAAVPVGAVGSVEMVSSFADETICLQAPPYFSSVGQHYLHFPQVSDDEVMAVLQAEADMPSGLSRKGLER
jgi:predicted phosphoribosyltransferase